MTHFGHFDSQTHLRFCITNFHAPHGWYNLLAKGIKDQSVSKSMVICEVPEARLSVNDKTTDSDEVYFNTKTQVHIYSK